MAYQKLILAAVIQILTSDTGKVFLLKNDSSLGN